MPSTTETESLDKLTWGTTWPSAETFEDLALDRRVIPVVRRVLADDLTPVALYRVLAQGRRGTFLMESAEIDGTWSRYSFVGVRSRATLTMRDDETHWVGDVPAGVPTSGRPLDTLRTALAELHSPHIAGLPPFTGGFVGAMGWDIIRQWEPTIERAQVRELHVPDMTLLLTSDLAAIDHTDGSLWLIANAINYNNTPDRVQDAYRDAVSRLNAMERDLVAGLSAGAQDVPRVHDGSLDVPDINFRTSRSDYSTMIARGKEAIRDGDVFQIVLSQRFDLECTASPLDVYRVLRTVNPSPYMYVFELEDDHGQPFAIVGSSPETLVRLHDGSVTTYPIAGSRPRGATREEDQLNAKNVQEDPKEVAEHIMLVDLSRNDLVKVCEPGTIEVAEFMHIKRFSHIMHMCSTVVGKLKEGRGALDVFTATFPAGTLSGAPKNRAIELIHEFEAVSRGIYGGTVGYFSFDGNMDMAIAIRTAYLAQNRAYVQAGGGIVADSEEELEFWETRNKAQAVITAIQRASQLVPLSS
ncbi:anthranilate synthase component I [Jonesia denitrificans]|uniref:Anthranilate synthase component 1 n=1 Tax=Jonesia denitrificans (strain ATCC 14870 / DSM 20603 / BCRC 15368 / CIP 55.134 / JCM 11481 / NBRC 15587 / NCTC 10816 / Prevot 55134) TaxID=471856 RepID=C7R411_JONDD|nr:anthranilate synthase component I [Jonesia denitrificans]ACV08868.1 anthranilate synthase component I [Jonesia denitrificans DSM 20603]ASE09814.1 anthranilate synthase component I [Jonesia denitrificans]QXB44351.1 anthranilate synthase component I [Jonesia denitrificans]SQH20861.1 Anthranilate synthase component 1 [Jonesia denitrificans]